MEEWRDFPASVIERSDGFEYYPMFDLAVRYLLDEAGYGKTYADVLAMFMRRRDGSTFQYAFQKHMGISVLEYETEFFDLMTSYLASLHSPDPEQDVATRQGRYSRTRFQRGGQEPCAKAA